MHRRFANLHAASIALELEARLLQFTILSNVSRHAEQTSSRYVQLRTWKSFDSSDRSASPRQMFQEKLSTQWQKN
jgi:hypothetical protein